MRKYFNSRIFLLFLLIPFFKPVCFQYFSKLQIVEDIFIVWKILAACLIWAFFAISTIRRGRLSRLFPGVLLFELAILLITVYRHGYVSRAVIDAISITAYIAFWILAAHYNLKKGLRMLQAVLSVLMLINLAVMLIAPGGLQADLYTNPENALYFMVIDNGSAWFLVFCVIALMLNRELSGMRFSRSCILLLACCELSALLSKSATAIGVVTLLLLTIWMTERSSRKLVISPGVLLAGYLIIYMAVLFLQGNSVLQFVTIKVFQRTGTFSGRYLLWNQALNMIAAHPWIGYGRQVQDYIAAWGGYYSSHNFVLETMLQGGWLALLMLLGVIAAAARRLRGIRKEKIAAYLMMGLLAALLAGMMEAAVHSVYLFGLIALCYYGRELVREAEKNDNEYRIKA